MGAAHRTDLDACDFGCSSESPFFIFGYAIFVETNPGKFFDCSSPRAEASAASFAAVNGPDRVVPSMICSRPTKRDSAGDDVLPGVVILPTVVAAAGGAPAEFGVAAEVPADADASDGEAAGGVWVGGEGVAVRARTVVAREAVLGLVRRREARVRRRRRHGDVLRHLLHRRWRACSCGTDGVRKTARQSARQGKARVRLSKRAIEQNDNTASPSPWCCVARWRGVEGRGVRGSRNGGAQRAPPPHSMRAERPRVAPR